MKVAIEAAAVGEKRIAEAVAELSAEQRLYYEQIPEKVSYVYNSSFTLATTEERLFGKEVDPVEIPNWTHFPEVAEDVADDVRTKRTVLSAADEVQLFLQYNYARYRLAKLVRGPAPPRRASRGPSRWSCGTTAPWPPGPTWCGPTWRWCWRWPSGRGSPTSSSASWSARATWPCCGAWRSSTCRAASSSPPTPAGRSSRASTAWRPRPGATASTSRRSSTRSWSGATTTCTSTRSSGTTRWTPSARSCSGNRAKLSDVERTIVMERFAIASRGKGRTLAEVGKLVGLTNERVRQIQNLALGKIRQALSERYLIGQ